MIKKYITGDFINGSAIVYKKDKTGLVKGLQFESGKIKWFDDFYLGDFHCGLALIDNGENIGYINRKGDLIIPFKYVIGEDFVNDIGNRDFRYDRAVVSDSNDTILIDTKGNEVKRFNGSVFISEFAQGFARKIWYDTPKLFDRSLEIIDLDGETVATIEDYHVGIGYVYELIDKDDNYSDGLIRVKRDYYGFVDLKGNTVIPEEYNYASAFSKGISAVDKDGMAYFIDNNNKKVLDSDFEFEDVKNFSEGLAPVKMQNRWSMIDLNGDTIIPGEFEDLSIVKNREILFKRNGKWGMMDKEMNILLAEKYDSLHYFIDGISEFTINGVNGVVDRSGNELV